MDNKQTKELIGSLAIIKNKLLGAGSYLNFTANNALSKEDIVTANSYISASYNIKALF